LTDNVEIKSMIAGAIFVGIGALFSINSVVTLRLGTADRMGPGYFPVCLGIVLAVIGVIIIIRSIGKPSAAFDVVSWRAITLITSSIFIFCATIAGSGLVLSSALTVLVASFASRKMTVLKAVILSGTITGFMVAVFSYGLGVPVRLFGAWVL